MENRARVISEYTGILRGFEGPDWRSWKWLEAPTVKTGALAKIRILYSRRKFGNGFAFRGCNGWKALVIVAREGRSNLRQGFVQLRTCSRVGRGCYTTKKKCNFRQLSHLDGRQLLAICNLPSAICHLKSQIVLGFHLRPEAF